jgi:hypothetical protein
MKKDLVLHQVKHSVSSIFSKEDVINLINSIDEVKGKVISEMEIGRAIDNVIDWIENNQRDLINFDSAEFELNYHNTIELINVELDAEELRGVLESNFSDFGEDDSLDADEVELQEIKRIEEDNN